MKNYYAVLGLTRNATPEEIKIAYRESAKRYHPDLNPGNEQFKRRFLEIKEAYELLSDPVKKKAYDDEIVAFQRARAAAAAAEAQAKEKQSAAQQQTAYQQQVPSYQSQSAAYQPQPPYQKPAAATSYPQSSPSMSRPVPPQSSYTSVSRPSSIRYTSGQLDEIKKLYDKQLAVIRSNSKKDAQELKKRLQAQIDAHKKHSAMKLKHLAQQYKADVEKARREANKYKSNYKKSSFNAGMAVGIKEAYDDCKKTIDELKKIISETNTDLEKLRADKQKLEQQYFAASENDLSDASMIKRLYREKSDLEAEFGKTKNILRTLEIKLAQKESEYNKLAAELDLYVRTSKNDAQLEGKELKEFEGKLTEAVYNIKTLEETISEKDDTIEEQSKTIEELRARISTLMRHAKIFGRKEHQGQTSEDTVTAEKYEEWLTEQATGTLYGTLGIHLHSLPEEIDDAFDKLSALYKGKKEYLDRYIEIVEAYNILNDDAAKAEYDASIGNTDEF